MMQELSLIQLIKFAWNKKGWIILGSMIGVLVMSWYAIRFNDKYESDETYAAMIRDQTEFYITKVDPIMEQLVNNRVLAEKRYNTAIVTYEESPFRDFGDTFWSGTIDFKVRSSEENEKIAQKFGRLTNDIDFLTYLNEHTNLASQPVLVRQLLAVNLKGMPNTIRIEFVAPNEVSASALNKAIKDYMLMENEADSKTSLLFSSEVFSQNDWGYAETKLNQLRERAASILQESIGFQKQIDNYVSEHILVRLSAERKSPTLFGLVGGIFGGLLGLLAGALQFLFKDRIDSAEELHLLLGGRDGGDGRLPIDIEWGKTKRSDLLRALNEQNRTIIVKDQEVAK